MANKQKLNLELHKDLWIYVEGNYTKPESKTGYSGDFEIENIELTKGNLHEYTIWCSERSNSYSALDEIETLCMKKLENN